MLAYIIRRTFAALVLLLVVSAVTFGIFFLLPRLAGETADQLAAQYIGKNPSPEAMLAIKKNLGFDQPLYIQFGRFIKQLFFGAQYKFGPDATTCHVPCFGYSFKNHLEVWPEIESRLPVTISLAIGAAVLWVLAGISTGVVSALKPRSIFDRLSMGVALAGVSLPIFFTGALLLFLFSYQWPIFDNLHYVNFTDDPLSWARNLVLPWIALAFLYSALYARLTRSEMLDTMNEDYIRTARAKGLIERRVVVRHGLRAVLTPLLTIFGMDLGLLLGGAVITEQVFSLQGIGAFAVSAIGDNDLPKILGVTLVAAFFIILCNLLVDLLYAAVDPRVRLS
ncbi:ABC transporter permease [Kitasatospora sp. NPDC058965]|uniref:ABC transporter permease n=1 Tax=Kitasatospora sp. NPDC058965 TaxID=3346682 RepID=UPI0036BF31D7